MDPVDIPRHPSDMRPVFPLSQDILYTVVEHFDPYPLATYTYAALVARDWTAPAQAGLYRKIDIYAYVDTAHYPVAIMRLLLARTMRTSPHLRVLFRSLRIVGEGQHSLGDSYLDWLRLVPPHTLQRFEYTCIRPFFSPSLMEAPVLQTVPALFISGVQSMDDLKAVLVPGARSLFVRIDSSFDGEMDPGHPLPPNLAQLTISSPFHWCPAVYKLFIALSPQLDTFTTDGPWYEDGEFYPWMESTLARYGRSLRALHLHSGESIFLKSVCTRPFLDDLVSGPTRLEHITVLAGTYTDRFFRHLPASVRVLEFAGNHQPIPFEDALLDCIARARRKSTRTGSALSRIVVFSYEGRVGKRELYARVAEACEANDVRFEYAVYEGRIRGRALAY